MLGQVPSGDRLWIVRAHEYEPRFTNTCPRNRSAARWMVDALERFDTEQTLEPAARGIEVANDEIDMVNARRGHAQAAVGNIPAFGSSAGTPRPSSASSQRLVSMIFASSTPVSTPDRSSM